MSTEENRRVRPTLLRSLSAFRAKAYSSPRSSAWRLKLPNINADKVAAEPAHAPALRRLFPIAQRLADKPAHILEFHLSQRPLDRKRQVPQCRQTLAQLTPRASVGCEPSGTSSNALRPSRRRAPQSPPSRPSIRQRSQPPVDRYRSETVVRCSSSISVLPCCPSSSAMTARTPNPLFVSGPPSTPASRLALRATEARRGRSTPQSFRRLLPALTTRPAARSQETRPPSPAPLESTQGAQLRRRSPLPAEVRPAAAVVLVRWLPPQLKR